MIYSGALDHDVSDEAVKVGIGANDIGISFTGAISTGSRGTWIEVQTQGLLVLFGRSHNKLIVALEERIITTP